MDKPHSATRRFLASVIIPAHDEERTIARNLTALLEGNNELDVIVICNGCTDQTATIARGFEPAIRVLEIVESSKNAAVRLGNQTSTVFPRVHLDADVTISGADVRTLIEPLQDQQILATAPARQIPRTGCARIVRWYYDVWEQLPQVRTGLFGRGVFVLSRIGQERVSALPEAMSDDLAGSEAFAESERLIVKSATVTIWPPRTVGDLLRRRVRVITGTHQADQIGVRRPESATGPGTLMRLGRDRPRLIPRLVLFVAITVVARIKARRVIRRGDFTTWQRDESSRS